MAAVKFDKGSEEWMMFMDFWKLCQKHWEPEDNDRYWDNLIKDCDDFFKKYKEIPMSRNLACALSESLEKEYKKRKSNNG